MQNIINLHIQQIESGKCDSKGHPWPHNEAINISTSNKSINIDHKGEDKARSVQQICKPDDQFRPENQESEECGYHEGDH